MENKNTALVNEHLQSLHGMKEASTDEFFYTRLKARMGKNMLQQSWNFPLKPAWVIGTLVLLLAINGFMLAQQSSLNETETAKSTASPIQNFAKGYNLGISSFE